MAHSTSQVSPDGQSSSVQLVKSSERGPETGSFDPNFIATVSEDRRSTSNPLSLVVGTGYNVYKTAIIPAIQTARHEVILVTCFWAPSVTRDAVNDALRHLSTRGDASGVKFSVQICFSSSSLARNMLWPTPKDGQTYGPKEWKKLGLPNPEELTGLDLKVTRKYFWPFGIIHSKYVIVDREFAIFPSCNVSWERWYEIGLSIRGPVVEHLLLFHTKFWENGKAWNVNPNRGNDTPEPRDLPQKADPTAPQPAILSSDTAPVTLLPSPHTGGIPNHLQPQVLAGHCPCLPSVSVNYPSTPLLTSTIHLLGTAKKKILMFTPNLTEPTVIEAITQALERGVGVQIVTNQSLMTAEQLVTAGTTTPACIKALQNRSTELRGRGNWGSLNTMFFDHGLAAQGVQEADKELIPVKLHAKVTIVDGDKILLGSGNMDAASWKTSQELGILIESREVVSEFTKKWKYGKLGN